ncbi:hypothetical protein JHK82_024712 [Glycine max]|nr:hypothetical protein JHK85_025314 [Glycine max]KAG5133524.1 hypothetical protein JHK82_024712 [Glycine max]
MADASSPLMDQLAAITLDEVPKDNFSDHIPIQSIISHINGGSGLASRKARVGSWVKTGCKANKDTFALLEINDRSCTGNLQVIVEVGLGELGQLVPTRTCVVVDGHLKLPPYLRWLELEILLRVLHIHFSTRKGGEIGEGVVVQEKGKVMSQLKAAKASKKEIGAAVDQLKKANESLAKVDQLKPEILKKDDGKDYFATPPTIVPRWIVYVVL